jgi:hypothetical protein
MTDKKTNLVTGTLVNWFKDLCIRHFGIVINIKKCVRPSTLFVKNSKKKDIVVLEIGTQFGYNAFSMLRELPIKKLYLVDAYKDYIDDGVKFDFSSGEKVAHSKVKKWESKIVWIKKYSSDAADEVKDDLDFVYIDGNHSYEFVKKDIELYYPKIKPGGVIAGHDFAASFMGLCKAVTEFSKKKKLKLYGKDDDWWMVKK